jgi:hypothetical protein
MPMLMGPTIEDDVSVGSSDSMSTCSSITLTTWADVLATTRYLALWQGRIVYSDW